MRQGIQLCVLRRQLREGMEVVRVTRERDRGHFGIRGVGLVSRSGGSRLFELAAPSGEVCRLGGRRDRPERFANRRSCEEACRAARGNRDSGSVQGRFEYEQLSVRPREHRTLREASSAVALLMDRAGDRFSLVGFVRVGDEIRCRSISPGRDRDTRGVEREHRSRDRDELRRRAVVGIKTEHGRAGIALGELGHADGSLPFHP